MRIIVYGLGKQGTEFLKKQDYIEKQMEVYVVGVSDSNENVVLNQMTQELFVKVNELDKVEFDYIVITSMKFFYEIKDYLVNTIHIKENVILSEAEFFSLNNRNFECNMCGSKVAYWNKVGLDMQHVLHKNIIGAGVRYCVCPVCESMDRTRYVYQILKEYTDIFDEESHVLHFASEKQLRNKLLENKKCHYLSADITHGRCDVVADITKLQFEDETYDYIICNHVLEHIKELSLALSELRRVVKRSGKVIVTVPMCWEIKTYENDEATTEEERYFHFGQRDHVRLFGNDIVEILGDNGFKVSVYRCKDCCEQKQIDHYKLISEDSVFILTKC